MERDQKKRDELERRLRIIENDMKFILSKREGRRFLWHLMSNAGVFQTSFSVTAEQTAFKEGRRDVGLWILNRALRDQNGYLMMVKESEKYDIE